MVEAVKQFAAGKPAIGATEPHVKHARLRSFEGIVAKGTDWRTLNASPEERSQSPAPTEEHAAD